MLPAMRGRTGRIGAALAISVGVVAGWFALDEHGPGVVGELPAAPTGPMSIWPESPFGPPDALRLAQDRVDAGGDLWRRRADAVTVRFARTVFGWDRIEFGGGGDDLDDVPQRYRIRPMCTVDDCAVVRAWTGVSVDRLGRQDGSGIWSVVGVTSARLRLPVASGATLAAGEELALQLDLRGDEHAAVGIRYVQRVRGGTSLDCGDGFEGDSGVLAARATLVVPDPLFDDQACSDAGAVGYVFAYSTPRLTVQTGEPLLEPATITDLAIVPVWFSQGPMSTHSSDA